MTVYLTVPIQGYAKGVLTGNQEGQKKEILLDNGKLISLYPHEFHSQHVPFPDKNFTFCACGNSLG